MMKKRIAIIGATGFTGSELVRILHDHPAAEITVITSESRAGERFSDVHPFFKNIVDVKLEKSAALEEKEFDLAFLALPHGVSMNFAESLVNRGVPVIDLSGDFRLSSPEVYSRWYNKEHTYKAGFGNAVYGLPELFGKSVSGTPIVANPGCYPTSVILAAAPLIREGLVDMGSIIADSKSGVTGAGVKAKPVNHFSTVNDNFKAYGLMHHRHTIEIEEALGRLGNAAAVVQFTPHLLPIDRGILSTVYMKPAGTGMTAAKLKELFNSFYKDRPFIRLRSGSPAVKEVRGTNFCDLHAAFDERTGNVLVISAIDNLVKGAAGQAVQNMNLIFNWDETLGLDQIPLCP